MAHIQTIKASIRFSIIHIDMIFSCNSAFPIVGKMQGDIATSTFKHGARIQVSCCSQLLDQWNYVTIASEPLLSSHTVVKTHASITHVLGQTFQIGWALPQGKSSNRLAKTKKKVVYQRVVRHCCFASKGVYYSAISFLKSKILEVTNRFVQQLFW